MFPYFINYYLSWTICGKYCLRLKRQYCIYLIFPSGERGKVENAQKRDKWTILTQKGSKKQGVPERYVLENSMLFRKGIENKTTNIMLAHTSQCQCGHIWNALYSSSQHISRGTLFN